MLISFSGTDGCGKTTLAMKAVELLEAKGLRADYVRIADRTLARKAGNLMGMVSEKKARKLAVSPNKGIALLRKSSLLLDALIFRLRASLAGLSGKSIVCDRYFFDSVVHLEYIGISAKNFEKLLLSIAPKPGIAFLVTVPPQTALARDKEFPRGFYKKKNALYLELFGKLKHIRVENLKLEDALKKVNGSIAAALEARK